MFRGPLTVLLLRLGVVGVLYSLLRLGFWLYNRALFPAPPLEVFLGGLRFDASAIAWTNLPWVVLYLVWPTPSKTMWRMQFGAFMLVNAIALFFNCVDLGYYAFSLKRSTVDFLHILTQGGDTVNLAPAFVVDYWHILLLYIVCLAALAWAYQRIGRLRATNTIPWPWQLSWRAIALVLLVLASRGGMQLKPLQPLDAVQYGGPQYLAVVVNTSFTMIATIGKTTLVARDYMAQKEADALWPVKQQHALVPAPADAPVRIPFSQRADKPNVVVIILESFSALYSARLSGSEGYMPFLDSLMDHGISFTNAYANGRRSIDGIPAILASMPQWMDEAFVTSPYASQPFTSLASILAEEGYITSFYHGGRNGTMGFDAFAKSAGFQRYVGLNEYADGDDDFDGHWGVRDRPFLQFYAHQLAREQQPFMSTVFTLSSHHPYALPQEEAARFAGGTQPIHPTLRYADDALRQFFATARTMPWFENTLFVITSDHTADLERTGSQGNKPIDYWVPLLYYSPRPQAEWGAKRENKWYGVSPGWSDRITQHIDIVPTALYLVGYDKPFFSFGHHALRRERLNSAIWFSNGIYTSITPHTILQFDGKDVLERERISEESSLSGPELQFMSDHQLQLLKAAIQQFNGRMIRSELTLDRARP